MRQIISHVVNGLNECIQIMVHKDTDPDNGVVGPCEYGLYLAGVSEDVSATGLKQVIRFQQGPIAEAGVNGISNEALLAIVEDRLLQFNVGPYRCRENALALTHLQEAMHWLHHRTRERTAREVEGTSNV